MSVKVGFEINIFNTIDSKKKEDKWEPVLNLLSLKKKFRKGKKSWIIEIIF